MYRSENTINHLGTLFSFGQYVWRCTTKMHWHQTTNCNRCDRLHGGSNPVQSFQGGCFPKFTPYPKLTID